jgi:cell division protein FtsB
MTNETNVEKWVKDEYKKWCKATNRGGGVLMGQSIIELLTHFAALTRQGDETAQGENLYMHFIDERGKSVSTAMRITPQDTIAALHQQINDLKEQLQSSRVVYQDPDIEDVKVTEADQAEYEAGMHRHFREKYAEARARITALEAENKRLREGWVRCSDKMPENLKEVLAYVEREEQMVVAVYEKGEGWYETYNDATIEYPVTHWMPLPTPPAQTDNDKKEMV